MMMYVHTGDTQRFECIIPRLAVSHVDRGAEEGNPGFESGAYNGTVILVATQWIIIHA